MAAFTRSYLCIDLKCFYASVECVARNLDPFTTNLVVADPSRGRGALCLAVSPKMKTLGVRNRCRIYEIPDSIDYMVAVPRMNHYIEVAADVYAIYLKYVAKEDIHVYSIDECFLDVTSYLSLYRMSAEQLAKMLMADVLQTTGVCATVGLGTNLYLAKIALDLTAKHTATWMGFLDEATYRKTLWKHQPLTDFWQIGRGIARRLAQLGMVDMEGVAQADPKRLYAAFGVNAEYLIDHAWGREPTTIADIKAYQRRTQSLSRSQILFKNYTQEQALLVLKEMVELLCLDLADHQWVAPMVSLSVGYAAETVAPTGGSRDVGITTNAFSLLLPHFIALYEATTRHDQPIRRVGVGVQHVKDEAYEQYDLFTDLEVVAKEKQVQATINHIKKRFGNNAVLKAMNVVEGATTVARNKLIGGHNAE